MVNFTIKERVEFRSADFQEDTRDFVANLAIYDLGGFEVGLVKLVVNTPEALIELGKDLMLAGAQLRQFVDEWPEGLKPEHPKEEHANGYSRKEAAA
jgi:hypothetical protein